MPAVQTSYSENIRPGLPGMVADMRAAVMASRTAVGAVAFGTPAFQGTTDRTMAAKQNSDTATDFLGIVARDRSVTTGDGYVQHESVRICQKGPVWVVPAVNVVAGDPVFVTATGTWSNVTGTNFLEIAGARWDTSASAAGLAVVVLK